MTRIMRLLLIAAIALPLWQPMAAQKNVASVEKNVPQLTDANSANEQSMPTTLKMKKDDSSRNNGVSLKGVVPPSSASVEQWSITTTWQTPYTNILGQLRWQTRNFWTSNVDVVVYGNYIYIRGLCYYVHNAWIKGTIDGTTVNFGGQIQCGLSDSGEMIYLDGINGSNEWEDIVFTYNPGAKTLTLASGVYIWESTYGEPDDEGTFTVTAKSRHSGTTIKDNVQPNQYLPVYGSRYSQQRAQHSQMIYPESSIIFYKNSKLKSITFYTESGIKFYNGKVTVSLAVIDQVQFSGSSNQPVNATLTEVASITPSQSSTSAWTITFNEPFEYQGGNLLIDLTTERGTNGNTSFYLKASDYYSSYYSNYYNSYGNTCIKYLPVVTFGYERMYEEREITVLKPNEIAAIPYTWKDDTGTSHEGHLDDVATDPDQIIAMLKEVYTNKDIPGNKRRGFTSEGTRDHDDVVPYTAVGTLSVANGNATFNDAYGWQFKDSEVTKLNGTSGNYQYWYMDPTQYEPEKEGLTLLLLELKEDFTPTTVTDEETGEVLHAVDLTETEGYAQLRECVDKTIKSARIISESKRTGEGMGKGTMFKIDCDKMNKFYLIAKGQLLWFSGSSKVTGSNFYDNPCYIKGNGVDEYVDKLVDKSYYDKYPFLCHMFEQFSPALGGADVTKDDIYQELTKNMQSFGVNHDCPNVPYVNNGHHFMMYDTFSEDKDCQDVRDMMFFVPDYRMMDHSTRNSGTEQDYFRYHPTIQPTMGMFIIKQYEIEPGSIVSSNEQTMTGLYKHSLTWKSNLDDFLPGDMQEYELWEVVIDEYGVLSYQPVYYRNADGSYVMTDGAKTPIVLDRQNMSEFAYENVYVDMQAGSQTKTYVIRGRDKGGFLSLQMSNMEEIVIPGLDPNEKAHMVGATYYSRYNPDNEKNCYSNKIELVNNGTTLDASDLSANNNKVYFYRLSRPAKVDENGNVLTDEQGNIQYADAVVRDTVATGTANGSTITIALSNQGDVADYPNGSQSGTAAGYHPNNTLSFRYSTTNGHVQFTNGFFFWDNFTVDVSENKHPLQYLYKMEVGDVYSNDVRVPVFKTDSKINSYTQSQVDGDTIGNLELEDVEFSEKVQLSSKTEILRYDVYRWNENEGRFIVATVDGEDEQDLPPTGIAGNQGEWYTVTMNDVNSQYYYAASADDQPAVSTSQPFNWATFIDYYAPSAAHKYLYAPVVELFTKGYMSELDENNNKVPRKDYNTYGGPQQITATGELEIEQLTGVKPMSTYFWTETVNGEEKRFAYYDIQLNVPTKEIPNGYSIYKVRVWRQILDENGNPAPGLLREEYANQSEDIAARMGVNGRFMFEINYDDDEEMYAFTNNAPLGSTEKKVTVTGVDGSEQTITYTIGTFGAQKLRTEGDEEEGVIDELNLNFKVRMYFTRTVNLPDGSKGEAEGKDDKFYIVEQEIPVQIKGGGTITSVENMNISCEVVGVKYYNVAGIESDTPFQGVNIVVTRYSDGSKTTTKILK